MLLWSNFYRLSLYRIEFHESLKMPYVYVCVYKKVYT